MKTVITTMLCIGLQSVVSVKEAREAYFASFKGAKQAQAFSRLLDSVKGSSVPLLVCYKGAAEMMKAKNAVNPITKYSFFKRGKALIEAGIARDTLNAESRFIRFSIQHNLPGFLGYRGDMGRDSLLIAKALPVLDDEELKVKIRGYFGRLGNGSQTKN